MTRHWRHVALLTLAGCVGLVTPAAEAASRTNHLDVKKNPPYYTGKSPKAPVKLAYVLRAGSSFREPGANAQVLSAVDALLEECHRELAQHGLQRIEVPSEARQEDLPITYVGHPDGFWAPDDAMDDEERARHGRHIVMIWVSDPPSRFAKQVTPAVSAVGADHVVYVTLELSDYAVAQKNLKGSKAIELGTGYTMPVPWLTSLDQLAEVLQFKGVLYRADGRFVRAGAEAFHAQRTPFRQAILNAQRTMQPSELEAALRVQRADLTDQPLAWQVAVRNLLAQLTGSAEWVVSPRD